MQPPEKIFAKSLAMRNLSTFVTVVCLMQKRNQKRKKKTNPLPPSPKKRKKNMQQKQGGKTNTTATTTTTTSSSKFNTTTPTIWWCDRERTTRACLKKRGRFCGEFLLLAVFFFTRFVYACDEFYGRKKKRVSFLTSRERFLLFWYL